MEKLFALAAIASLALATPALAQIGVELPGVGIEIGPGYVNPCGQFGCEQYPYYYGRDRQRHDWRQEHREHEEHRR